MSTKQDIWMPLFIGDYLRDTTRLTTEKHGAYLLLIMDYWVNGAPPDDDEVLASITKMQLPAWRKTKPSLIQLFNVVDGFWHHKRIDEELLKASENAERYATRAKKAADKRWNKDATSNASSIPSSNTQEMLGDMLTDATSPSPSSIKTNEETHTVENCNVVEITEVGRVCLAIKHEFDLQSRAIVDMSQSNPTFLALIESGATVQEFSDAARITAMKGKGFNYLVGMIKRQREDALKLTLHRGTMPQSQRDTGRNIAAKSIFKPENITHLGVTSNIEIEVQSEK